jgi:hypothetical protein
MLEFISNLQIHGVAVLPILSGLLSFVGGASVLGLAIAPLTKTTKDDAFWAKVQAIVLKLSLNITPKAK